MRKRLNQAWIIRWVGFGDPESVLKRNNLNDTVFDFLSPRHDFDKYVISYAENIYRQRFLSLTERFGLAHYNHRKASEAMFGAAVPVTTYRSSGPYRELCRCFKDNDNSKKCQELKKNWRAYPEYVIVGHNPAVEIKKVFNLDIECDGGNVQLSWDEPMADGTSVRKSQNTPDLLL